MNSRLVPEIRKNARCQRGAALLIALLMLVVLLMFGIAAVRIGLQGEKASRNWRDRQIAWQAAEAAMLDAEYDIRNAYSPRAVPSGNVLSALKTAGVGYGNFTGRIMQTGIGALPALRPRYLIETLPRRADQQATDRSIRYRVNVIGFGPDPSTTVILQSIYRHQPSAAGHVNTGNGADPSAPSILPSMRLSWREIAAEEAG
jgi:type IV pilus assembly protein PilX